MFASLKNANLIIRMILDQIILNNSKAKDSSKAMTSETTIRSVVKTLSWRTIGTIDTVIISWLITGQVALALSIGSIELVSKMILYFFHERIWNVIKWGKNE